MSFKKLIFLIGKQFIDLKWKILEPYYVGLAVQTRFLYRQSTLFKDRWQQVGLEFAEQSFENNKNEQTHFFRKAQKEPFSIRFQIFWDTMIKKEKPTPYYLPEKK